MREFVVEHIEEAQVLFEELLIEHGLLMFIISQFLNGAGVLVIIPDEAITPTFTLMFADSILDAVFFASVAAASIVAGNFFLYLFFRLLGDRFISSKRRNNRFWRFMEWAIKGNAKISLVMLRLVPMVGGMAAIPAGLVKVRVKTFLIYSFIGFLIYELVLSVGIWYSIENDIFVEYMPETLSSD